jgi:hypothetical protein
MYSFIQLLQLPYETAVIVIPILQMMELRAGEVKELLQQHMDNL